LLQQASRTQEAQTESLKSRRTEQQTHWDNEKKKQQAELLRQREMLAAQAENLEQRHHRLDELREELERTHSTTLEARMAVEEIFAQISQAVGSEVAEQRVSAARNAISEHYRKLRDSLASEREELIEERKLIDEKRNELRDVRSDLSDWIAEREEKLRLRDAELREYEEASDDREQAWRNAQQRWQNERIEAEGIIRDLMKQIGDIHLPAIAATITPGESEPIARYRPVATDDGQIVPDQLEPIALTEREPAEQSDNDEEPRSEAA
jgi:chromosome segregation ATPase